VTHRNVGAVTTDSHPDWPHLLSVALGSAAPELLRYLGGALGDRACSGSHRETARWARGRGVPWDPLVRGLRALGALCDCETLEVLSRGCSC
jgi:hypothetical protein